jgi:DNA-binding MarR family transcriptional regulator/GNAT superfamily N-acetyltransferase
VVAGELDGRVAAVRRFNRWYTRQIGLLGEGYLESPFSLTEARVLYELANRELPTASELGRELGLDAGYLSRILRGFQQRGLLERTPSPLDGRQSLLRLTESGRAAFAPLDARSQREIGAMLGELSEVQQGRLVSAMATLESLLGARPEPAVPYLLWSPGPGDLGWVVSRHGALYAQEYGWNEQFEALVASIVAKFVEQFEPKWERCWIAERDGQPVGSVFVVRQSSTVAKLRLLLVEPEARGLGIGQRLVAECLRFARSVGYREMVLWTNSVLVAARRIYQRAGFELVREEAYQGFGQELVGEDWRIEL